MKQKIAIALSFTLIIIIFFWACKDEELPEITISSKIELIITEDSTSYVFSEITCALNLQPKFTIEQHGFCWDTIASVNIEKESNSFENLTTQSFTETIENLQPNKTYYVKAYIQNGDVIIYSNELTIQTIDARPIVTTNDISNILANSVECGGIAEAYEALFSITQRGVCWAKTQNPTITDSLTINGTGNGIYTSQMQYLDIGVKYYARAYAINSAGIGYGEEKSFSTLDGVPELTTDSIKNITTTSATFYGNIIDDDGLEILEKGFCWNTSTNPTIENNFQIVSGDTLGSFSYETTELIINTTYHVRAYLKNSEGTFYGNEISFTVKDGLSIIITNSVTEITTESCVSGGNITDDGGFVINYRGVCWSTNPEPSTADDHTNNGSGIGDFISNISGLDGGTTYYIRAYAINSAGTGYGNEISFNTSPVLPNVTTNPVTDISPTTAVSGGEIISDGGSIILSKGVCWSTTSNPTIADSKTDNGSGLEAYISNISGLSSITTYYLRAYATNDIGTSYGNEITFTTSAILPTVSTNEITNILTNSATGGGNVTNQGDANVTEKGICWSMNTNPIIEDNHTSGGSGIGTFTSQMTNLYAGTTYYVRAYATSSAGTAYGEEKSFSTNIGIPAVISNQITEIDFNSATSGGNVMSDGGSGIISRGVCWNIIPNPEITDFITDEGSGLGEYISSLDGLSKGTTYYLRAYATNSFGTGYGNSIQFITNDSIHDIDGNMYITVNIGSQIWLKENLKTTHYQDGSEIPNNTDPSLWYDLISDAYCYQNNDISNLDTYGALYNYYTVVDSRGLCPSGWHVSSDSEWYEMAHYVDSTVNNPIMTGTLGTDAGAKLKSENGWINDGNGTDIYGFNGLPGGYCTNYYANLTYSGHWYSSTEEDATYVWGWLLDNTHNFIQRGHSKKSVGMSVRCIKD